jgi:uncharacterized protein YutD
MEIKEIVTYFLNSDSNILDVSFRTIDDDEDMIRIDNIDYRIVADYGFDLVTESFGFFDDDEDDLYEEEKVELDEYELLSFLNEYYIVNPKALPKGEIY